MDNILKSIKDFTSSLFSDNKNNIGIGIDIGTSSIKVVQVKRVDGRAVLDTYGALSLGQYIEGGSIGQVTNLSVDIIVKALADVLTETKIKDTSIILGLPSVSCIVFIIQLPAEIDEVALATTIPLEAKKFIPVPIEEVSLDWYVIPQREDSGTQERVLMESGGEAKMSILVVATLNETLNKYTQIMQKSNLPTNALEIELFSSIRSLMTRELFPVLIIDVGASKTKLTIVEHGIVETFRLVNKGSQDITTTISKNFNIPFTKAESLKKENGISLLSEFPTMPDIIKVQLSFIFQEANNAVLAYEKRYNKNINKIIFTGGGSMLPGLIDYAKTNFSADVELADPFAKVETPVFLKEILKKTGPEFSVAIGLALKKIQ